MDNVRLCAMTVPDLLPRLCRAVDDARVISIEYTNRRGETAVRRVLPTDVRFGLSEWHGTTWHLEGIDAEKGERRSFAVSGIVRIPEG